MEILSYWDYKKSIFNKEKILERGIDNYINQIQDKTIQEICKGAIRGTVPVALYGKTQVGKTTFTLKLLDIKDKYFSEVYEILRCGQPEGSSATPTAMIYHKSIDNYFRLQIGKEPIVTLHKENIREELIKLRYKIENNNFFDLDHVSIEIPNEYFNENNNDKFFDIKILDLPGYGSKNEKERPHVDKILKKYLPLANLILVFEFGEYISQVNDLFSNEVMSKTYGWKYFSSKYRLIVTRAYSANKVKEWIYDNNNFTSNQIQEYYREQLFTKKENKNEIPDNINIYPLEFGKSWDMLLKDINFASHIKNIELVQNNLLDKIKEDIKDSLAQNSKLKTLRAIPNVIKKRKSDVIKTFNQLIDEKDRLIELNLKKVQPLKINIEKLEDDKKEIERKINEIKNIEVLININQYDGPQERDEMRNFIQQILVLNKQKEKKIKIFLNSYKFYNKLIFDELEKSKEQLMDLDNELSYIIFNKSRWFGPGPDKEHVEKLQNIINEFNYNIKIFNSKLKNIKNNYINNLSNEIKTIDYNIKKRNEEIENIHSSNAELDNQFNKKKIEYQKDVRILDEELQKTEKINDIIFDSFEAEISEIYSQIKKADAVNKLFSFLIILDLLNYEIKQFKL